MADREKPRPGIEIVAGVGLLFGLGGVVMDLLLGYGTTLECTARGLSGTGGRL
jgi:hypothetical protein